MLIILKSTSTNLFFLVIWILTCFPKQGYTQSHNTIIITEFFVDPTPSKGLPEKEFVEIYNATAEFINLTKYSICDAHKCFAFPNATILPSQALILCKSTDALLFQQYGTTLGFPSFITLNNDADSIKLVDPNQKTIDAISYKLADVKEGTSLELIAVSNTCKNIKQWQSSTNEIGGTPGIITKEQLAKQGSIKPNLKLVEILYDSVIVINIDKPIAPQNLSEIKIKLDRESVKPSKISVDNDNLFIHLERKLFQNYEYELEIRQIKNCFADYYQTDTIVQFITTSRIDSFGIVINEVLFNPKPGGVDFVELLINDDTKMANIQGWKLANIQNGIIANKKIISTERLVLKPHSPLAITSDIEILKSQYFNCANLKQVILPSYNDDLGSILLLDEKDNVIDRFDYYDKMHSALLRNTEGVTLERIARNRATNNSNNWHSAAEQSGFATPGLPNSQSKPQQDILASKWEVMPIAFCPQCGIQKDFTMIQYKEPHASDLQVNIKIYDADGRLIKSLINNTTIPYEGFFKWDGSDDDGRIVPIGQYIVLIATLNTSNGDAHAIKKQVVITSN